MQKLFTDQTLFSVTHIKNLLEAAHIDSEIRNEFAAGGVGELSFIDAWPELWVEYEDFSKAKSIVNEFLSASKQDDWRCSCGELNGHAFFSCWSCGLDRPTPINQERKE
jgi:hypothetical protein